MVGKAALEEIGVAWICEVCASGLPENSFASRIKEGQLKMGRILKGGVGPKLGPHLELPDTRRRVQAGTDANVFEIVVGCAVEVDLSV